MALFDFGGGSGILGNLFGSNDSSQNDYANTAGQVSYSNPGFLSGLADRLNSPLVQFGLGLASGRTPQEGFGNALGAIQMRQKLAQAGLSPDIKEYQYARSQGYRGSFQDWLTQQANARQQQETFGLNPVPFQRSDGSWGMMQPSNRGGGRELNAPGGGNFGTKGRWINNGSEMQWVPNVGVPNQTTTSPTDTEGNPVRPEAPGPVAQQGRIPLDLQSPARVKMDVQAIAPLGKQLAQAEAVAPLLDTVIDLANKTPGGYGGPVAASVAKAASALGLPVSEGMSNAELMTSITRQLVPGVREPGPTSELEQRMYINAVPGIAQSPDGRVKIAEMNKAMIQRKRDIVGIYRQYVGKPELMEKLAELDRKPMFTAEQHDLIRKYGGGGSDTKTIGGKVYQRRGDKWFAD